MGVGNNGLFGIRTRLMGVGNNGLFGIRDQVDGSR